MVGRRQGLLPVEATSTSYPAPRRIVVRACRICCSSSTTRMRPDSVTPATAPTACEREVGALARLGLRPDSPAVGLGEPPGDRQASRATAVRSGVEGLEISSSWTGRMPGPWSMTRKMTSRRVLVARMLTGSTGGEWPAKRVLDQVHQHALGMGGIDPDRRQRASLPDPGCRSPASPPSAAIAWCDRARPASTAPARARPPPPGCATGRAGSRPGESAARSRPGSWSGAGGGQPR